MTPIQKIETEILSLQDRLSLRPTLDLARAIGGKLAEAKKLLPHGEWLPWLRRCCLSRRTASTYMQCANGPTLSHFTERMTIEQFLRQIRLAKRRASVAEREATRAEAAGRTGTLPKSISIHHADCAEFAWPQLDLICTDPPWRDMTAYVTLDKIAGKHLKAGGLLMVQCGVTHIGNVISIMKALTYRHTLAIVYAQAQGNSMLHPFQGNWRPCLVFSKGQWDRRGLPAMSDTFTMGRATKKYHDWEQPAAPFGYWLSRLCKPGDVTGDMYMGSGTIGAVCAANGLGYVGTEIDRDHYLVARGRLTNEKTPYSG